MFRIVAILQIVVLIASVSGINVFKHVCHQSGTVSVALVQSNANCSDHVCCQDEHTETHSSSSCCEISHTDYISPHDFGANYKTPKCCEDASDFFMLNSIMNVHEKTKTQTTSPLLRIDYNIPQDIDISTIDYLQVFDNFDISKICRHRIIEYIHNTAIPSDLS